MMHNKAYFVGIIEALLSAVFFGLIPLFFLPLAHDGFSTAANLFFRFSFASLIMAFFACVQKRTFRLSFQQVILVTRAGFVYFLATITFFQALTLLQSGIATTLFFSNPFFVMLFMVLFFKEPFETYKFFCSLIICLGVALLSGFFEQHIEVNTIGIGLSLFAGLCYALYIMGLNTIQKEPISKAILSCYIFIICAVCNGLVALCTNTMMMPRTTFEWSMLFGTGLITAVLANILLIAAIKKIGSVMSAILGATEPLTALLVGIVVFHERMTLHMGIGIFLILASVLLLTWIPMLRIRHETKKAL